MFQDYSPKFIATKIAHKCLGIGLLLEISSIIRIELKLSTRDDHNWNGYETDF